jgi:hypothetical protein
VPTSQASACRHDFLNEQGKLDYPVSITGTSGFGRFQPSSVVRADGGDIANLHPSDI